MKASMESTIRFARNLSTSDSNSGRNQVKFALRLRIRLLCSEGSIVLRRVLCSEYSVYTINVIYYHVALRDGQSNSIEIRA